MVTLMRNPLKAFMIKNCKSRSNCNNTHIFEIIIGERPKRARHIRGVQIRDGAVRIYIYICIYIYINTIADFLSHRKCIAQK